MKMFLLGVLFTVVLGTINHQVWENTDSESTAGKISWIVEYDVLQGNYFMDPIHMNCVNKQGKNGHGWTFNVADYYGCDRLQRLLNGNFTPFKPGGPAL